MNTGKNYRTNGTQCGMLNDSTTKKLYYFSNKTTKNKEKQIENAISF